MIIKVCGLREPENIRAVAALGVDMIGFIFCKTSPRYVGYIPSHSGLQPDYASKTITALGKDGMKRPKRVGVFVNEMPQSIINAVYNYRLDYVQLHGEEPPTMIDNLRSTIDPDIRPGIKFIKAISVSSAGEVKRWRPYDGKADMLLFDAKGKSAGGNGTRFGWEALDAYGGDIPFLLSGGICPGDAERVLQFSHPAMAGVDLNSCFETSPGVKDVTLLSGFINEIRDRKHS